MPETGVVFVLDNDPSTREFVEATLNPGGLKVLTFASCAQFMRINQCASCRGVPCLLLLELVMPDQSGLEFIERRYTGRAPCPFIMMTARAAVSDAVRAMKLGAADFLEKPLSAEVLTAAVVRALERHPCAGPDASVRRNTRTRIAELSKRERQLLNLVVLGHTTPSIAKELGIAVRTVDQHRAHLMAKMECMNTADLVCVATKADYESVPPRGPTLIPVSLPRDRGGSSSMRT